MSNYFNIDKEKIHSWIVISFIFLFPFVVLLNYFFNLRNGEISQFFRFFNLAIALLIIINAFYNILKKKSLLISISTAFMLCFWLLYLFRLIIDLEIHNLYSLTVYKKTYYYLFTIGVTFLPMVATLCIQKINFEYLIKQLKILLVVFNVIIFLLYLKTLIIDNEIVYRFWLKRGDFEFLNPISIATYASLLIILIHRSIFKSYYNVLLLILCSINLLVCGSRGPLLILAVVLVFSLGYNFKFFFKSWNDLIIKFTLGFFFSCFMVFYFGSTITSRLTAASTDDSTQIRYGVISNVLDQFLNEPVLGSHFLVVKSKLYSHNLILDIFLATGILGFLMFLPILIKFFNAFLMNKFNSSFLTIVVFFFLCSMFSGSVYSSYEFFISFSLLIGNFNKLDTISGKKDQFQL